jgi:hypothetical protein
MKKRIASEDHKVLSRRLSFRLLGQITITREQIVAGEFLMEYGEGGGGELFFGEKKQEGQIGGRGGVGTAGLAENRASG